MWWGFFGILVLVVGFRGLGVGSGSFGIGFDFLGLVLVGR